MDSTCVVCGEVGRNFEEILDFVSEIRGLTIFERHDLVVEEMRSSGRFNKDQIYRAAMYYKEFKERNHE